MSSQTSLAVSRDYVEAKRAYQHSMERLIRRFDAAGPPSPTERPVTPAGGHTPLGQSGPAAVWAADWFDHRALALHVSAFARYLAAHLDYVANPDVATTEPLDFAAVPHPSAFSRAADDFGKAGKAIVADWSMEAVRAYQRRPTRDAACRLLAIAAPMQMLGWTTPALEAAVADAAAKCESRASRGTSKR